MVHILLGPALTPLYLYVSTFRSMCAVSNMAVFCSSLTSCFSGMLLTYFLNDFEMVPVAPIIIGSTFVFTYYYYYYCKGHTGLEGNVCCHLCELLCPWPFSDSLLLQMVLRSNYAADLFQSRNTANLFPYVIQQVSLPKTKLLTNLGTVHWLFTCSKIFMVPAYIIYFCPKWITNLLLPGIFGLYLGRS